MPGTSKQVIIIKATLKNLNCHWLNNITQTDEVLDLFAIKHGLRSQRQLEQWIIRYNESNLKAYTPRKRDSKMSGRKTDFEERLTIIEELIKHDVNYNWAVEKYHISYQQVYGWYQKYRKSGNDPESLRDRRGKAKPEEKWPGS